MTELRYLTIHEVLVIYAEIIKVSVVKHPEIHNISGLKSALAQPQQTFDGNDLYPTIEEGGSPPLFALSESSFRGRKQTRCLYGDADLPALKRL